MARELPPSPHVPRLERPPPRLTAAVRVGLRGLYDFFVPPRCAGCRVRTLTPHCLCPACFGSVHPVVDPCCHRCGCPFDFAEALSGSVCAACLAAPPVFDTARAAALYEGQMRRLVLRLKYGGSDAAPALAALMRPALADMLAQARAHSDKPVLLVPVPLHRWRLMRRRYNQAQLLAVGLMNTMPAAPLMLAAGALIRVRATPQQRGLGARGRDRNVRGAFRVAAGAKRKLKGRAVVLVDDVYTTGATLEACTRPLKRAGASWVGAITAARVDMARTLGPRERTGA